MNGVCFIRNQYLQRTICTFCNGKLRVYIFFLFLHQWYYFESYEKFFLFYISSKTLFLFSRCLIRINFDAEKIRRNSRKMPKIAKLHPRQI